MAPAFTAESPVRRIIGIVKMPPDTTLEIDEPETTPFSAEKLNALYPSHQAFSFKWILSVARAVANGFIVPEDGLWVLISGLTGDVPPSE